MRREGEGEGYPKDREVSTYAFLKIVFKSMRMEDSRIPKEEKTQG